MGGVKLREDSEAPRKQGFMMRESHGQTHGLARSSGLSREMV